MELNNVLSRTFIPVPSSSMVLPQVTSGVVATSGFGYISNGINATGERTGQLVARCNF